MNDRLGADELVVQGYVACARCGEWLVDPGQTSTLRVCGDCRRTLAERASAGRLRYEVEGRIFTTKPRAPRKRPKPSRRKLPAEARDRARGQDRARMKAKTRLSQIYRPMYEILLSEEYLREGLDPFVGSAIPRPRAIEAELLRDLAEAEERDAQRGARLGGGA